MRCAHAPRGQTGRAAVSGGRRGERHGHAARVRTRGQGVRQGGEGLGVQGRAHARVDGSGGARGSAWGKGGGELSGAWGRAAEERKEGERGGRKKKREKEMEKEKEKEREREMAEIAVVIATERACAPVGRDARDDGEQGDGTAMDSDVGIGLLGRSGDRAGKMI